MKKIIIQKLKNYYFSLIDFFDFESKSILNKNLNLKNSNKRCFIIATGASLIDFDLDLIRDEYKIGFGFCFLHPKIKKGYLDSYVLLDNYLNNNNNDNFPKKIIQKDKNKAYSLYSHVLDLEIPNLLINYSNRKILKKEFGNKFDNAFYFKINSSDQKINFSSLDKRILTFPSTIIITIQIAIEMGFKEIYLLGAGYTYSPANLYHFYDTFSLKEESNNKKLFNDKAIEFISKRKRITGKDIGFSSSRFKFNKYFGLFYENRDINNKHYEYHKRLNILAKSKGVKIHNVIPEKFKSKIYSKISTKKLKKKLKDKF